MPHMLIEYTKDLEKSVAPATLIASVYQGACNSELFNNDFIKTRSAAYEHYQSGSTQNNFLHVTAKILSGRTDEQRKTLSASILAELELILNQLSPITITVEVVDIHKESHSQYLG